MTCLAIDQEVNAKDEEDGTARAHYNASDPSCLHDTEVCGCRLNDVVSTSISQREHVAVTPEIIEDVRKL